MKYLPWQRVNNKGGFTLIELSIVIALCALIVTLSGAHIFFLERIVVRAELELLYVTCYMLQHSAMMLGKPQTLTFDRTNNSYRYKTSEYKLPAHVSYGVASGVKGPPSTPNYVIANPITFKENKITFTPDGIIQPGAVYLTDRHHRCTYALSCAVSQVSYLRKYQYTNAWAPL